MEIKRILVTGTSGQLGYYLAADLLARFPYAQIDTPKRSELDCGVEESIASFFKDKSYDIIFHCAAYTQVDLAEEETAQCNTVNSDSIAWIAHHHPSPVWFWYFSTDYVFPGIATKNGLTEEDPIAPINAYGLSKWHGEEQVRRHFSKHTIVRVAWLYSTRGKNFFKTMLQLAETHTELRVVNDQVGSPTYVKDLSADLCSAIQIDHEVISPSGTYHYSPQGETTWHEFAQTIFHFNQKQITLHAVSSAMFPQKAKRPSYSYLSHSKWNKDTGIEPMHWRKQLEHCWKDWQKIQ